jgi:VanZ family protein
LLSHAQASIVKDGGDGKQVKKRLGILCGVALVLLLVGTLWPLDPFPSNQVDWIAEANGIRLGIPGVVMSKIPLKADTGESGQSCSLELLVRPARTDAAYTILSLYDPKSSREFLVRQWMDGLFVTHDAFPSASRVKTVKFDVDHVFPQGKFRLVTITSSPNGTIVYLDGSWARTFPKFVVSPGELSGELVLGNSSVLFNPWPGEIRGLAIYLRELTPAEAFDHYLTWIDAQRREAPDMSGAIARYAFSERAGRQIHNGVTGGINLEIPKRFAVPHKVMLQSPWKEYEANWGYVSDLLRNVAGFVPLGIVLCAYLSLTRYHSKLLLLVTLLGGILSFVIEVLQAYIPQRNSGMTDIITNTLGAFLGVLLWKSPAVTAIMARRGLR